MAIDVLLSGFEPFDGAATNESWEAVRRALPFLREAGVRVADLLLPVEFGRGADALLAEARALHPSLVVATGLAAGRLRVTPERTAVNVQDARIPDNAGASPVDEPCVPGGPVGYFSTLPIKTMVAASPSLAAVSQTAGTFVCNDVFYRLQHALATEPELAGTRGGFVHVPATADLPVAETARVLVEMLWAALRTRDDVRVSGGAES
ncbi:pyroglutamyl-peptidase I family protein [Brachybacterium hainanense]|uniref:Pyrrolidone-carboxylate peptidase n=1 Tax=Brachybacterium hainanense TaxID=1541174 RepID=A0ABV6R6D9_9MICO